MSTLEVGMDNLSAVDYSDKIRGIIQTLRQSAKEPSVGSTSISFDIDKIAHNVATTYASDTRYPFENKQGTTYASTYFPDIAKKIAFSNQIKDLEKEVAQLIQGALQAKFQHRNIGTFAKSLLKPVADFSHAPATGLKYPLTKALPLEKQKLHLRPQKTSQEPWLKGHKLTIQVKDITRFDEQLIEGICAFITRQNTCDDEEIDDARDALEIMSQKANSSFTQLRKAVIKESLARIQREAKIYYFRYLYQGMRDWKADKKDQGMPLLRNLIVRLKSLDTYIRQSKDDAYYQVTYQDNPFNFRDLFSRADAFETLPIIPEVVGSLGESTNKVQGSKTFVSGLKLKLNGQVQIHGGEGKPVYDYYLALLDPNSVAYQKREAEAKSKLRFYEKVLKVAMLYYFVFMEMDNPSFKPAERFEADILTVLRTGTNEEKSQALRKLQQDIGTAKTRKLLDTLKQLLIDFLDHTSIGPARQEETLVLSLKEQVLVKDVDNMITHNIFFQKDFENNGGRDILKYIAIENASTSTEAICKLPLTLTFEPMHYYGAEDEAEKFSMTYELADIQALPIFLAPIDNNSVDKYKTIFAQEKRIVFYYQHRPNVRSDSEQAFVYRFTYTLLAYLFVKVLAESIASSNPRNIFFPIVCLHALEKAADDANNKLDDEEFMHSLSKVLAHMLAEDYSANSQGFHLSTVQQVGAGKYKLGSALYSLYSALPRTFQFNESPQANAASLTAIAQRQLDKLAIVTVSSRKCDVNAKTPEAYQATIYGEVIGIERLPNGYVRVGTLSTFSSNQASNEMYERPEAILEQVKACYAKGYRHFLYVARAPYSSTLHISDVGSEEELFFMNKTVIQAIRDANPESRVYPVFCDTYYVVNQRRRSRTALQVDSLYIDDIGELSTLVNDPSKRSLVFFNLFNGANVNKQVYNGVMSYSTLLNVYENDPTYDQYIWSNILGEKSPQSLKTDILDFITLLHFSRYEKPRDLRFKLDPYKRVIGDMSVGKVAIFPNMKGNVHFNSLAFLTLVRVVLHAK